MLVIVIRIAITLLIVGVSVAVAAAQPIQQAYELALDDLAARVHQRTGTSAESCGNFFRIPGDSPLPTAAQIEGALACGQRAAAAGAPFWFAVGGHGLDSWVAEGCSLPPTAPLSDFPTTAIRPAAVASAVARTSIQGVVSVGACINIGAAALRSSVSTNLGSSSSTRSC